MQRLYVAGTLTECLLRRARSPIMRGQKCSVCMWLGPQLSVCLGELGTQL